MWRQHGRSEVLIARLAGEGAGVAVRAIRHPTLALVQRALQNPHLLIAFRNNRCGRVE
jgi:hypothetical protein